MNKQGNHKGKNPKKPNTFYEDIQGTIKAEHKEKIEELFENIEKITGHSKKKIQSAETENAENLCDARQLWVLGMYEIFYFNYPADYKPITPVQAAACIYRHRSSFIAISNRIPTNFQAKQLLEKWNTTLKPFLEEMKNKRVLA